MKIIVIGSGNDFLPVGFQAIIWTSEDLLSLDSEEKPQWNMIEKSVFIKMLLKMLVDLFQDHCINGEIEQRRMWYFELYQEVL